MSADPISSAIDGVMGCVLTAIMQHDPDCSLPHDCIAGGLAGALAVHISGCPADDELKSTMLITAIRILIQNSGVSSAGLLEEALK